MGSQPASVWRSASVDDLFYVKGRIGWRGLKRSHFLETGPYLITGIHIRAGAVDWDSCFHIPESKFHESPEIIVQAGDLIITKDGTIGKVAYIGWLPGPTSLNSHLFLVRPRVDGIDTRFAYHVFTSQLFEAFVDKQQTGTTRAGLPESRFLKFDMPLPPLPEQRRIAEILDTADEAIRQTERVIAKLKAVKAGLLHDLLTRGLDEHGRLRDPVAHPEQFKDSPLERIPREWETTTLGGVVGRQGGFIQTGPFGSQLHAEEYTKEGIPVIMPQDIKDSEVSVTQIARIPLRRARELARHRVIPNDVVFARRGDLSRCAHIGQREAGWLCGTGCLLVRPPEKIIDAYWLAATYQHDRSQRQIAAKAVGSTMVNLNTSLLASLMIAKPSYAEQARVVDILGLHDVRIRAEEAALEKLRQVKRGLMDDLLTGKVRVKK